MHQNQILTPADFIAVLKRRRWSLLLPALLVIMAGVIVAIALPPVFKSSATILIEEQEIPQEFVMTTVTSFAEQRIQQINQKIMSYTRLSEIIQRFDLYAEMRRQKTNEEVVDQMREDTAMQPLSAEIIDRRTGRPATATIAFTLSYQGKDPNKVLQVATTLTSLFLEENLETRARQAADASEFLENEMAKIKVELDTMDGKLTGFKEAHINELPEMMEVNRQTLNNLERDIQINNERLSSLREREQYLQTELAGVKPYIEAEEDATRRRLAELKLALISLTKRMSEAHPDVKKNRAEIAELENKLAAPNQSSAKPDQNPDNPAYISLSAQLAGVRSEINSLNRQLANLKKEATDYRRRIFATPKVEEQYRELAAGYRNTQAKYNDLMMKHMEARVAHGLEKEQKGERFILNEPPRLPEKPFKPNRLAIMLIGVVLGVGAGVGIAALREFSDDSVRKAEILTHATGFPVLAGIPEIISKKDIRRRRLIRTAWVSSVAGSLTAGVIVFHYVYMDLTILWVKLMRRMAF